MSDFSTSKLVKKSRQPHHCYQCHGKTEKGAPYVRLSGVFDGQFFHEAAHVECHDAAQAYADLHGLWWEEYPFFADGDFEHEDRVWMVKNYQIVADRLGWTELVDEWNRENERESAQWE